MTELQNNHRPVIFGEVLFDCFEDGSRVLGGAPFNVAWHLQAFGCAPLFVSSVGEDPLGGEVFRRMQDWGMDTAGVQQDPELRTGEVHVTLRNGQPSFDIADNRAFDRIAAEQLPALPNPALIYHGSLGVRHTRSAATLATLVDTTAAPVFLDINLRSPWWNESRLEPLLEEANWLKVNDDELHLLVEGRDDLQKKAQRLRDRFDLEKIIVTRGAQGAFALDNSHCRQVTLEEQLPVVDTVGAGDAFAAVCILGLLRNWPTAATLERAQQFAGKVVGQRGALIEDRSIYSQLRRDWRLKD